MFIYEVDAWLKIFRNIKLVSTLAISGGKNDAMWGRGFTDKIRLHL